MAVVLVVDEVLLVVVSEHMQLLLILKNEYKSINKTERNTIQLFKKKMRVVEKDSK